MSGLIWAGAIALAVLLLLWGRLAPSAAARVRRAARAGDLEPVLAGITRKRPAAQPTAFNHAIRLLWEMDERRMAVRLVRELVTRHGNTRIAQYWLGQVLGVEPAISHELLSRSFLDRYYRPEVAAQCGPAG